jgi:putative transposase
MVPLHIQLASSTLRKLIKRLHYPLEVMLVCVRWYAPYPLSLRNLEEMMAERGVVVDHATVHRWALKMLPVLAAVFSQSHARGWLLLVRGRDLHRGRRPVEVSVPGR